MSALRITQQSDCQNVPIEFRVRSQDTSNSLKAITTLSPIAESEDEYKVGVQHSMDGGQGSLPSQECITPTSVRFSLWLIIAEYFDMLTHSFLLGQSTCQLMG